MSRDKSTWPWCLVWHGWLLALATPGGDSPWAVSVQDVAYNMLYCAYEAYSDNILHDWKVDQHFLDPDVWTDGSLVTDDLTGIAAGGAWVFAHASGSCWFGRRWGHLDLMPRDGEIGVERCTLFDSLPGPLHSVQRAELWGVVLALQGAAKVHLGVDNLNVVRHVTSMISGRREGRPFDLCVDGDLLSLIESMVAKRGPNSTLVSKVKGHADMTMVRERKVRLLDKIGHDLADRAADFYRRRVRPNIIDLKRQVLSACRDWYPLIPVPHRFFTANAREAVNRDGGGGTSLHPKCWSAGGTPKRRKVLQAVRNFAWVPGPPGLWESGSNGWPAIIVGHGDVTRWPFSVCSLVKLCSFLSSLHWPVVVDDLGRGGVSYIELLIMYEDWAGERLGLERVVPKRNRGGRPISMSAVPVGPSIDIRRSCRFLGAMLRALRFLPGGLGRFIPCRIGANHCRLRAIGWER